MIQDRDIALAKEAMKYFDSSPDPFHAVQTSVSMLQSVGFVEWSPSHTHNNYHDSSLMPGGKYYFTKNKSTLVAFAVGKKYQPGNGFKIIGGHTDSPILKVKPRSKRGANANSCTVQLAVECYGGGLWHTWFDRDLGLSGRVFLRTSSTNSSTSSSSSDSSMIVPKLVHIDRSILHIPNLAIHLQSATEREAFQVNKEDHLVPILSMAIKDALEGKQQGMDTLNASHDTNGWTEHQESILLDLLAEELQVHVEDIMDFELNLFNVQKASLGGVHSEFIHSARLDNLASCFLAVKSLVEYTTGRQDALEKDEDISLVALFDHEEVGSESATGAGSPIMREAVQSISEALYKSFYSSSTTTSTAAATTDTSTCMMMTPQLNHSKTIDKSFVLSVDQAHAVHPNYAAKHEKGHGPMMNHGMVIKRNSNQRYATNTLTALVVREIARKAGLKPLQEFVVRNDCGCGTTIGPIISSSTGIRAIDLGCPQLSMHSIRETMGTADLSFALDLFLGFFDYFRQVDDSIQDKN